MLVGIWVHSGWCGLDERGYIIIISIRPTTPTIVIHHGVDGLNITVQSDIQGRKERIISIMIIRVVRRNYQ
jgi:hypothetical protein